MSSNGVALPSSAGTDSPVRTQSSRRDHDSQTRSPMSSAQARTESRVSERRQLPRSVSSKRPSAVVVHSSRATRPRSRRWSAPGCAPTAAARSSLVRGPAAIASARPRAAAVWIACGTHRLEIIRESRNGVGTAAGVCWVMLLPPPAREDSNGDQAGLGEKSGRGGRAVPEGSALAGGLFGFLVGLLARVLGDACGAPRALPKVVQLRAPYRAAHYDLDALDPRRVDREDALHADAIGRL